MNRERLVPFQSTVTSSLLQILLQFPRVVQQLKYGTVLWSTAAWSDVPSQMGCLQQPGCNNHLCINVEIL